MVASSLRGEIAAYFITESGGQVVTLRKLCQVLNIRYADEQQRARVRNACGAIRREGKAGGPIQLDAVVKAQAWKMVNYAGPVPTDPEPALDTPEPGPEVVAELEDEDPPAEHLCPYEVVGLDSDGNGVVRNTGGALFRLTPL